jgi:hypothetical protein
LDRRRRLLTTLVVLLLLLTVGITVGCAVLHGHVVDARFAPNHSADFDFKRPPCEPAGRPAAGEDDVLVRYLGTSGLYIEWRGSALLTAPFFSNPGLFTVAFGRLRFDDEAIRTGLAGIELGAVRALLAGHAHYDHVGDLPRILPDLDPEARLLLSRTAWNMLAECDGARRERWIDVGERYGEWIPLDRADRPWARVMPIASGHAPHIASLHLLPRKNIDEPWEDCAWERRRLKSMPAGQVVAYLIDLLDSDGGVRFRLHYQDAASEFPLGSPEEALIAEHDVDVAVVCMPSSWLVEGYPEGLLGAARARHALVTHYEDFFRSRDKPLRFVASLTNGRAERFMDRVAEELSSDAHRPRGPANDVCGPASESWTVPLPGEWLRFSTRPRAAKESS